MLLNLHVKNLALIEEVDVDFTEGLIVLTGETGAGKSLILGSVNIALGNKASKEMIRTGTDYCLVELTFKVDEKCARKLKTLDIYMEDDGIVTVTRKISQDRSVAKICGETVNVKILKQVMELMLDIHGQHDHQSLLYSKNHLDILDKFAKDKTKDLLSQLKIEYENYTSLQKQLAEYNMDESYRARETELAKYEIDEIEEANLMSNEDTKLEEEYERLSGGKEASETLALVYNYLSYDSDNGAGELINRAITELNQINFNDETIDQFKNTLYDVDSICRELTGQMLQYSKDLEYDPQQVYLVENRLDTVNHLKLKYGQTIEKIKEYKEQKEEYLDSLENYSRNLKNIKNKIEQSEGVLTRLSDELSDVRNKYAKELEKSVKSALVDLNFLSVDFKIQITKKDKISEKGYDNVEFLISTNPGEPLKPLSKVASGGELSRIMLAIKSILAEEDEINTLIFDEIDTGISGKTALMVAEKLAKISKNHQVICISHLAQIAAMADSHYLIEKKSDGSSTSTNICKLNREQSINELIRLSGGTDITEAALAHATEMKEMADKTKQNML